MRISDWSSDVCSSDLPQVAPANERLEKVTGLAYHVSDTEHALLNAARVNVLRSVPGRGLRPMGARTRRKDGPFRQIAIRRLVNFIVETLDEETQWLGRSEERRLGKECVSRCRSRWSA